MSSVPYNSFNIEDPYVRFDDLEFKRRCRINKPTFDELFSLVGDHLKPSIKKRLQKLTNLLETPQYYKVVIKVFRIKSSPCTVITPKNGFGLDNIPKKGGSVPKN